MGGSMAKTRKKEMRRKFREDVFKRDGYRCVVCGFESSPERAEHELDAHHITPREQLPHGGYVKENGVSLCDPSKTGRPLAHGCHYRAEQVLLRIAQGWDPPKNEHDYEYSPVALYEAIDSSHEGAVRASEFLK
jgi:hypothetical protein